jgi:cytochrome c
MLMTMEVTGPIERGGRYWAPVVGLLGLTVVLMLQGRHMYREEATREHRQQMADASRAFAAESAYMATADDPLMDLPLGERTFRRQCATCHAMDERLTGPPMLELSEIYRDRGKRQLIDWVKQPGRERKDYPAMPAITLTEEQYGAVADYVLGLGAQAEEEAAPEDGSSKEDGTLPAETPAE